MDGNSTVAFTNSETSAQNYSLAGAGKTIIARAIVPVKVSVKGRSESVTTYAFLDNGSDSTFCTETLAQQLGVKGKEAKISLTIMEKTNSLVDCSIITNLTVSDLDENSLISLPVMFTTKEIPIARREIPNQDDIDEWSYLRDVHLPELDAKICLLVGSDVPQALEPIEFRNIQHGGPYATRTVLGWTINGPLSRKKDDPNVRNFFVKSDIHLSQVVENAMNQDFTDKVPYGSDSSNFFAKSETPLNDIVLDSINRDFNERAVYDKKEMSQEEQQFMSKVKRTVSLKNGHYQIALPFKDEHPQIPNNRTQAEQRMTWLKKRLQKNPQFHKDYTQFVEDLLKKNHARKVPQDHLHVKNGKVRYIPHHSVYHPHKPGKIRVVFDCSCKFKGTSLNDYLLTGPDLT